MQALWGKVLAREVASPGTFGFRTLDTLRQLSRHEAEIFRRVCGIATTDGWIAFSVNDINTALIPIGVEYQDILTLRDAGSRLHGDQLSKNFTPPIPIENPDFLKPVTENNGVTFQLSGAGPVDPQLPALIFTKSGLEIQRLIEPQKHPEYLKASSSYVRQHGVTANRKTLTNTPEDIQVVAFYQDL